MKKIFLLLITCLSISAMAQGFSVKQMKLREGFDYNFDLDLTSPPNHYGQLNCQDFIQNIQFSNDHHEQVFHQYLSIVECEQIYLNIKNCFAQQKEKCFKTNDVFSTSCDC